MQKKYIGKALDVTEDAHFRQIRPHQCSVAKQNLGEVGRRYKNNNTIKPDM